MLPAAVRTSSARTRNPLLRPRRICSNQPESALAFWSRTRAFTEFIKKLHKVHYSVFTLLEQLPEQFKRSEEARFLASIADRHAYNLVRLVYRPKGYEGDSKDYEFSRQSMTEHWRSGYYDAVRALRHLGVLERPSDGEAALVTFDFTASRD